MNLFIDCPLLEQFASLFAGLVISLGLVYIGVSWLDRRMKRQLKLIQSYAFPASVKLFVKNVYPHLTDSEIELALEQLRVYFLICWHADACLVLPSKVVDVFWEGFLLEKESYAAFRRAAFGRIYHQMPVRSVHVEQDINLKEGDQTFKAALGMVQVSALNVEHTNAMAVKTVSLRVPMLFCIDEALKIPGGYLFTDEAIQLMVSFDGRSKKRPRSEDL